MRAHRLTVPHAIERDTIYRAGGFLQQDDQSCVDTYREVRELLLDWVDSICRRTFSSPLSAIEGIRTDTRFSIGDFACGLTIYDSDEAEETSPFGLEVWNTQHGSRLRTEITIRVDGERIS